MTPTKQEMLDSLPVRDDDITIRSLIRDDIDNYAQWPQYPSDYEAFNTTFSLRFAAMNAEQRNQWLDNRIEDVSRILLTADSNNENAIAYIVLRQIDWNNCKVGNMGFLVKPTWTDKGIGTRIMKSVTDWSFKQGIISVRLDVVAPNIRAVRCYEKVGFIRTGEFWKDEEPLRDKDINLPEYDSIRPHFRMQDGVPQIRFWWMELNTGKSEVGG